MQEKLIIKNFGPIKDVELELGRFNILIGEQATGKSTVAKVLAVCRYFSYIVGQKTGGNNFSRGLKEWGLTDHESKLGEGTYISYECEHYFFEAWFSKAVKPAPMPEEFDNGYITYEGFDTRLEERSNSFKQLLKEFDSIKPEDKADRYRFMKTGEWIIPTSFFQNEVAAVLENPFYFPIERSLQSLFSLGKYSTPNFYDKLYEYFAKVDRISQEFDDDTSIEPLGITYKNEGERGFIKSDKHDFVRLNNAASGYQSTIPVVLVLKNYNRTKRRGKTFIIEEPELNLFPNAQQKLMEYLVEQVNQHNNSFLINTHSPYTLTSLNNMMYAWQVGQEKKEEVAKVIDEKHWMNPNEVKAYQLLSNGTCESLISDDGLLKVENIDVVSRKINAEYDKIANIEYSNDRTEEFSELQTSFG